MRCENVILDVVSSPLQLVQGGNIRTIVIIAPFFTSVGNETLAPIDRPFAMVSRRLSSIAIGSHTDTDKDVALGFLWFRITLACSRYIICILECRCTG